MHSFIELRESFYDAILDFNAWIKAHRKMENQKGLPRLNLNNVGIKKLVNISLDKIERLYSIDKLCDLFPEAMTIDEDCLNIIRSSFDEDQRTCQFRGKYQAEFLRIIITNLIVDRSKAKPQIFKKKGAVKITVSKKNFISDLSQYAQTPECLTLFLQKKFSQA